MTTRKVENLKVLLINPWADRYAPLIKEEFPTLNLTLVKTERDLVDTAVADVDVVISWEPLTHTLPRIKELKWYQCLSAGFNHILDTGLVRKETIFTNAAGAGVVPVSEFVFAFLFGIVKRLPELQEFQRQHRFEAHFPGQELYGKTVGVLGLGHIGRAVVRKSLAMDMKVIGFDKFVTQLEGVTNIYPFSELEPLLRSSDFVVVCLPLNKETESLIGEKQLDAMKPTAHLINVARGEIVVREALVRALKERRIAGAALDVFWGSADQAGLGPEDELWDLPNVIISPHCASMTDMYVPRTAAIFCRNLESYLRGEQLINVIDH